MRVGHQSFVRGHQQATEAFSKPARLICRLEYSIEIKVKWGKGERAKRNARLALIPFASPFAVPLRPFRDGLTSGRAGVCYPLAPGTCRYEEALRHPHFRFRTRNWRTGTNVALCG